MTRTTAALLLLLTTLSPAAAASWEISRFHTALSVRTNGVLEVEETIKVFFLRPKHGIYRTIPLTGDDFLHPGRQVRIRITDLRVDRHPFQTEEQNGQLRIRIGRERFPFRGEALYRIRYRAHGALLTNSSGRTVLFWNLIGREWPVAMERASWTVSRPRGLFGPNAGVRIHSSRYGFSDSLTTTQSTTVTSRGALPGRLPRGTLLTAAINLPDSVIRRAAAGTGLLHRLFLDYLGLYLASGGILLAYLLHFRGGFSGRRRTPFPPDGMTPMEAGFVLNMEVNYRDLLSLFYHWAAQGRIRILLEKDPSQRGGWGVSLERCRTLPPEAPRFERALFAAFFSESGRRISFATLPTRRTGHKLEQALQMMHDHLEARKLIDPVPWKTPGRLRLAGGLGLLLTFPLLGISGNAAAIPATLMLCLSLFLPAGFLPRTRRTAAGTAALQELLAFRRHIRRTPRSALAAGAPDRATYLARALPFCIALGLQKTLLRRMRPQASEIPAWFVHPGRMPALKPEAAFKTVLLSGNRAFLYFLHAAEQESIATAMGGHTGGSGGGSYSGGAGAGSGGLGGGGGGAW